MHNTWSILSLKQHHRNRAEAAITQKLALPAASSLFGVPTHGQHTGTAQTVKSSPINSLFDSPYAINDIDRYLSVHN
jgi:hypothetical protein